VIPLSPEAIQNTDGTEKQDCEINAGKRLIKKFRKTHPKLKIIYSDDDLFSNQPFIDELKAANMSFILVAKPSSHIILYEWFTDIKRMGEACRLEFTDFKDRHHNENRGHSILLNFCENVLRLIYMLTDFESFFISQRYPND